MKTKVELIKNYPVESLKNWGDYFGYPDVICKEMINMAGTTDWQNAKIAVLDDFGFQMINFLINVKKVPLQNIYFLVSEEEENKVELMKKWYSNLIENEICSIYNIDMSFDLIIANPPYGKSSSLSKKIVNKMLESKVAKEIIYLSPTNTYKGDVLKHVQKVQRVDWGAFEDVDIYDLCVTILNEKTGPFVDYASFVLNEKLLKLYRSVQIYNKIHSSNFKVETRDILDCKKDWDKTFAFSFAINNGGTTDATPWEDSIDLTCFSNKRNGPTGDIKFNFGKDFESFYKRLNGDVSCLRLIDMHSEKEKVNFSHWYYKASPLVNAIRAAISQCENITPRAQCYIDYFPHLDWSHPWADQEILAELGLPEDFLN